MLAECCNSIHVAHFLQILIVPDGDLLDLVGGTETVKEVDEGNLAGQSGQVSNGAQVHDFLHVAFAQHGKAGLAAGHDVGVVTEDVQGVGGNGTGADVEHARQLLSSDLVHVGDHQQQTLGCGVGGGQGTGAQRTVDSTGSAGLGLHLDDLNLLIKESEKFGTAGLTSHQSLHKGNLIIIKVTQNLGYIFNTPPFDMEVYLNTTIYDLKKEISQKVKCHFDFIKFIVNYSKPGGDNKMQQHELTLEENGETLFSMGFSNEIQIELRKNNLENSIPKALLIDNGTFTEEAFILFDGWYNYYSIEGQMTLEKCAEFVKDVTSSKEPVLPKDSRVIDLANGFDFIRKEDFLQFYREKSMTCNELVFENINALGYRNDLKPFSEEYFQPITQPELLPRYQIAQDNEFFTFIFDLLQKEKTDNALNEKILIFINNLVTNPQIFNKILEHSNDNWKDILNVDNVFRMIYNFDIIQKSK